MRASATSRLASYLPERGRLLLRVLLRLVLCRIPLSRLPFSRLPLGRLTRLRLSPLHLRLEGAPLLILVRHRTRKGREQQEPVRTLTILFDSSELRDR